MTTAGAVEQVVASSHAGAIDEGVAQAVGGGDREASGGAGAVDWARQVIPARYYLYSFQDIPARTIYIPEHIPAYLGIYDSKSQ
jgi:hypothetical protein